MKKIFICFYSLFIIYFMNILNCNAECSYQERKDLLNSAKNVEIFYEINEKKSIDTGKNSFGEEVSFDKIDYIFNFKVTNLSSNLFISYVDSDYNEKFINFEDLKDNIYSFEDNNFIKLFTYEFKFHSLNENCLGETILTKKVVKPYYNGFSDYEICKDERLENFIYCKTFLTSSHSYNENEFIQKAKEYIKSVEVQDEQSTKFNFIDFILNYYLYFLFSFVFIGGIIAIVLIRKKRSKL